MRAAPTRSFFFPAATAGMAGSAAAAVHDAAQDASPISAAGLAMIAVLAVCFVILVGLVVTLPAVKNCFRRVLHSGPGLRAHAITGTPRSS